MPDLSPVAAWLNRMHVFKAGVPGSPGCCSRCWGYSGVAVSYWYIYFSFFLYARTEIECFFQINARTKMSSYFKSLNTVVPDYTAQIQLTQRDTCQLTDLQILFTFFIHIVRWLFQTFAAFFCTVSTGCSNTFVHFGIGTFWAVFELAFWAFSPALWPGGIAPHLYQTVAYVMVLFPDQSIWSKTTKTFFAPYQKPN